MGSFRLFPGQSAAAAALAEVPTGTSVRELQERAAVAEQKAAHYAASGPKSMHRVWSNASERLKQELMKRLQTDHSLGLSDVELLGRKMKRQNLLIGGGLVAIGAGLAYLEHRSRKAERTERAEET